ncbi:hypothetical protein J3998_10885 [Thiomicrorhabdus sp. 6S2-11]|jgi:hypothetical protein|uniref:Uncharacterized protein n=1 Tax=Thiomicrorhabdus marina TaxID=2818442 RepID=A0ABS3Q704_9GAMM|nr:hypothetical protein [Thiomicrorhabdus marina]MBO1928081.1 hypothetical protein [Thiomicrorhabdus marina]
MMRLFGFISIIVWIVIFIALAIMFDWFNSREVARDSLVAAEEIIQYLEQTGDGAQGVMESVSDGAKDVKEGVEKAVE